jgi:oligosaccharyltransferase complex subunit epsilon
VGVCVTNGRETATPSKLKIIDAYMVFIMLTGIFQFVYCVIAGTYPFNSFLAGFISTVGSFVLAGKSLKVNGTEQHHD